MKTALLILSIIAFCNARATNYYFSSTAGDDSRSVGQAQSPATPWRSLDKLNSIFNTLAPGDSVLFKRGDSFYGSVNVTRSGKARKPISFGAYGTGASPVIHGLTTISSWTSKGNGLYETTLTSAPVNSLMLVLFDGALQPIGRYPKPGKGRASYFYISTPDPIISTTTVNSNDIGSIPSFVGGELVQKKDQWIIDRSVITAQSSNTIVSTPYISTDHPGSTYPSWYNHGFFFQNHVNACTQLGDWCYNNAAKKLTMYFGATNPNDYTIQAATLDTLFYIKGQDYISFSGLTLMGANQHIIKLYDATNVTIDNCDISYSGVNGITVDRRGWNGNTNNNALTNSNIHNVNNNGLDAVGSTYWTVTGNYIHDIGMVAGMGLNGDAQYVGVFNIGSNSLVEYNKVENIGYHGIYFSGNNTIIRHNELKNYVAVKSDGGGIYTYEASGTNRLVEYNICHDGAGDHYGINIDETNPYSGQVHGIYMDGNTANVTIRNNTCFNNSRSGVWVGSNSNVSVYNNTLYNNTVGQICGLDSKGGFSAMTVKNNILFSVAREQLCLSIILGSNYYSSAFSMDSNYYCRPISEIQGINTLGYPNNNLVNFPGGGVVEAYDKRFYSLDTWQRLSGLEANAKKTPVSVSDVNNIRFEYNTTNAVKTVALDASYIDVTGKMYTGSLTLDPYTSVVLIKADNNSLLNQNPDYQPIPGRIEAESFSAKQWAVLEACTEGGQDATGFGLGSWMDFNVNVAAAGTYTMNFRVSGWGGQFQVRNANGTALSTVTVPSFKGWQSWSTISTTVNLAAGQQTLRLYVTDGGFNITWFEGISNSPLLQNQTITFPAIANKTMGDAPFALSATASSGLAVSYRVVSGPATVSGNTVTITGVGTVTIEASQTGNSSYNAATPVQQSFSVSAAALVNNYQPIPGRIEAESYSAQQWVILETCVEGGQDATAFGQGSWIEYKVNVAAAGTYTMNFRVGGWGGQFQVRNAGGSSLATVNVPSSNGWQNWKTVSTTVSLPAGQQVLRLYITDGGFNINWFEGISNSPLLQNQTITFPAIANKSVGDAPFALSATASSGLAVSYRVVSGPATVSGNTVTVTGAGTVTIEASQSGNSTYNAATPVQQSFTVTAAVVQNQTITFPSLTSKNLSDLPFALNATASSGLPVSYRVVSGPATILGNIVTLIGIGKVSIEASQAGNSNYNPATPVIQNFNVGAAVVPNTYQPIPGRIETETYSAQVWTVLENCSEGGQDATGFGPGSWLDYKVNVAAAGTYTMNFRVGGWGGQFQVRNAGGSSLATVNVPSSNGWQNWKTVSTTLTLPAGQQVLRLYITVGGFNLNWFEGIGTGAGALADSIETVKTTTLPKGLSEEATSPTSAFSLYPVPAISDITLQLSNTYIGTMKVVVVDEAGRLRKEFKLQKQATQFVQQLSLSGLAPGAYLLQVQMKDKTEAKPFIKQ